MGIDEINRGRGDFRKSKVWVFYLGKGKTDKEKKNFRGNFLMYQNFEAEKFPFLWTLIEKTRRFLTININFTSTKLSEVV